MNRTDEQTRREANNNVVALVCPACGAAARRENAHFCATCGRGLRERAYAPADSLLASYHLQHSRPAMLFEEKLTGISEPRANSNRLFDASRNTTPGSALVIVIFALVPFLGILFCPCAIVMGVVNLRRARSAPNMDGRTRVAFYNIACGVLIFGAQTSLWWFLYQATK